MKLNETQLYSTVNEFIEREIMPLSASMPLPQQFMFGFKMGIVKRKLHDVLNSYLSKEEIKMLNLIDDKGYIDIDTMYQAASDVFKHLQQIELAGIKFKESDLQSLYGIAQKYAS